MSEILRINNKTIGEMNFGEKLVAIIAVLFALVIVILVMVFIVLPIILFVVVPIIILVVIILIISLFKRRKNG